MALTFTMLKNHSYHSNDSAQEQRLMAAIDSMVERFQQLSGMAFSSKAELVSQLFAHRRRRWSAAVSPSASTICCWKKWCANTRG